MADGNAKGAFVCASHTLRLPLARSGTRKDSLTRSGVLTLHRKVHRDDGCDRILCDAGTLRADADDNCDTMADQFGQQTTGLAVRGAVHLITD